jgi:hypothetical protein
MMSRKYGAFKKLLRQVPAEPDRTLDSVWVTLRAL